MRVLLELVKLLSRRKGVRVGVLVDTLGDNTTTVSYRESLGKSLYMASIVLQARSEARSLIGRIRAIFRANPYRRSVTIDTFPLAPSKAERDKAQFGCI
jgi:hypothetical protein